MTVVLIGESSGESKLDTIIPVPAPVKNSTIDFSFFYFSQHSFFIQCLYHLWILLYQRIKRDSKLIAYIYQHL